MLTMVRVHINEWMNYVSSYIGEMESATHVDEQALTRVQIYQGLVCNYVQVHEIMRAKLPTSYINATKYSNLKNNTILSH